jgi:hypothetical protein
MSKIATTTSEPNLADLSFIGTRKPTKDNPSPRDFWIIAETGDWAADNDIGRAAAIELARDMTASDFPPLLGYVVSSMIEKGRFGGVEVGFLHFFAEHAMSSFSRQFKGPR